MRKTLLSLAMLVLAAVACMRSQPEVIVITATFLPPTATPVGMVPSQAPQAVPLSPVPASFTTPTPDPARGATTPRAAREYTVQAGDTLYGIALANNMSLDTLLEFNTIADPSVLSVGQVIQIPGDPEQETGTFKILPDNLLVRGPGSSSFDIQTFVNKQPGYIRIASDAVQTNMANGIPRTDILTGAQIVERVSMEYSVDPRLLLGLLEYRAGWLSNPNPSDALRTDPMISADASGGIDRHGLYKQLAWVANELNRGYYGWKYDGWTALEFPDGVRRRYGSGLNAATVALQYFLSLNTSFNLWQMQIGQSGFFSTYYAYFGDPFSQTIDPLVPSGVRQPDLTFPFPAGEVWYFTGGPHGGWGTGSAWSAIDFAPPDSIEEGHPLCYTSKNWVTAVAPGIIARSDGGAVILDLDGDGDESTGWTVLYLHMASDGRVPAGTVVKPGDHIGHPSCEGGFSTATHMHIARRYNGEWIPADCQACANWEQRPPLNLSGWTVVGYANQEYQGYMQNGAETRVAEQGRDNPNNEVSW